jgi:type VI secretion system FHA domain protein
MSVTVKIFTKHGGRPTLFQTREFEALPVTLGRDETCTIALDDPMKHISRVHVELEEGEEGEEGLCWISVVSKVNPVIVKGRRHGPGSRVPLESGDSFGMGEFEVQVLFAESESHRAPISPATGSAMPATISPVENNSVGVLLAAAEEMPALAKDDIPPPEPGLFDEPTFMGANEPTYLGPSMHALAAGKPPPAALEMRAPADAAAALKPPASSVQDALRVFLESAGMPAQDLTPEQSEKLLREYGAVLRAAVEGLTMLLVTWGEMRKEFEPQEGTKVAARETNPLKLMSQPQEGVEFVFDAGTRSAGFLEPVPAIRDATEELRAHQLALMAGLRAVTLGALRRFDPQVLEKAFEKSAGGFNLGGRKAKMWELFLAHQQKLAQETQQDFGKVFGRDFMAAYEAQLRRLKARH